MTLGDELVRVGKGDRPHLLLIAGALIDSEYVLEMLTAQFPQADIRVEVTLEAALAHLASHQVDLVLADLSMVDAQGVPVVHAVRSTYPTTALMVMSSRGEGELELWALADGSPGRLMKEHPDGPRLATAILQALDSKRANDASLRYLDLAQGLFDALEDATCAVDSSGRIVAVNRAWLEFMAQNDGVDELCGVGVNYLDVCQRAAATGHEGGGYEAAAVAAGLRRVLAGEQTHFRQAYPCHSPDENRWFNVRVTPARINDGDGAVITHLNMTELYEVQRSATHLSLHDMLTGLPNRVLMVDRLEQAITDAGRRDLGVAVTELDLDGFHRVNDRYGYANGDALLVQVAERLQSHLRPGTTLARTSGDRFVVIWRDVDTDRPHDVVDECRELVHALRRSFEVDGTTVDISVTATAGVAVHVPGQSVDDLLQSAEAAMRAAKSDGTGHVQLCTDALRETFLLRAALEADLRATLEAASDQLVLHYQPVVHLLSGDVVAVEALVRWQHPDLGLLSPDRFIPMAEATGLIHPLGDWVLAQAIRDAPLLTHEGRELDIAVNVSVRQLDHVVASKVQEVLEQSALRPGRLTVEITESAIVEDEETTVRAIESMSQLGINISIDDFGTGYSSLHYVRRFPIDSLKIDREFVAGLGRSADDEAICRSIVDLGASVGVTTVGEGVETSAQYAVLRELGCHRGQGYLWSPAVPVGDLKTAFAACDAVPVAGLQPSG